MSSNGDHHMGGGAQAEASTEPVLCSNGCGFYGCARTPARGRCAAAWNRPDWTDPPSAPPLPAIVAPRAATR